MASPALKGNVSDIRRYMPIRLSNIPDEPTPCDGACVIIELSSSVFIPGAMCWNEIPPINEHAYMVRLFLFVLDVCILTDVKVFLETVVTQKEHDTCEGTHGHLDWRAYRLWVPLNDMMVEAFVRSISHIFIEASAQDLQSSVSSTVRSNAKRAKSSPSYSHLPMHQHPVVRLTQMIQLLQTYMVGRGFHAPEHIGNGTESLLIEILDHERYFESSGFTKFNVQNEVASPQTKYDSYFKRGGENGALVFSPNEDVRKWMQCFRCGVAGFLKERSTELLGYLLPHVHPSDTEIIAKLRRDFASKGRAGELDGMSRETLLRTATDLDIDTMLSSGAYSQIYVTNEDLESQTYHTTHFRGIISSTYPVIKNLSERYRFFKSKHDYSTDPDTAIQYYTIVVRETTLLLSSGHIPGIPAAYSELWKEAERLTDIVRHKSVKELACERDHEVFLATRKILASIPTEYENCTPLTGMIDRLILGASFCVRLLRDQAAAFVPFYIASFGVTDYDRQISQSFMLTGPPGTGKSTVIMSVADCVAQCLVSRCDSTSGLAETGQNSKKDLRLRITDEYKQGNAKRDVSKSHGDASVKNDQTRLADGYVVHERLEYDQESNLWVTKRYISVCRSVELSTTNDPEYVATPIRDRSTMVPLTLLNVSGVKDVITPNYGVAISANPRITLLRNSWTLFLRYISSHQIKYNMLAAVGGFPDIDERCFEIFWGIFEEMVGKKAMAIRKTRDLKTLATNIRVMNVIYVWYLRMEDVVTAYVLLEKSKSMTAYIDLAMRTLKDNILITNGVLAEVEDYWVLRIYRRTAIIKVISSANPDFGDGLTEQIFSIFESTSFNGQACVKREPYSDGMNPSTEHYMVNKAWISSVLGSVEHAIINLFERLYMEGKNTRVFTDYSTESMCVFSGQLRLSLRSPQSPRATRYQELKRFSDSQVQHAFCMLCERLSSNQPKCHNEDDERVPGDGADQFGSARAIQMPTEMECAIYRPETAIGVEPSILDCTPKLFKIRTTVQNPLVVDPILWEDRNNAKTSAMNAITNFIKTAYAVSGEYSGMHVTTGSSTEPGESPMDSRFFIDPTYTCRVLISNPFFNENAASMSLYGEVIGAEAVMSLFPVDQKKVLLTETSAVETVVAEAAKKRVAIDAETRAIFDSVYARQ